MVLSVVLAVVAFFSFKGLEDDTLPSQYSSKKLASDRGSSALESWTA